MSKKSDVPPTGYRGKIGQIRGLVKHHMNLFFDGHLHTPVPYIKGPPGIGKTDMIHSLAAEFGVGFKDLPLIIWDTVDMRGIPYVDKDRGATHWALPSELPSEGRGVLFLDEFTQAFQSVQNCASRLILARKLGEYVVPPGWFIVLASNRDTDRSATHKMASFLNNRLTHYEIEADVDQWVQWAVGHGINGKIIAFLKQNPQFLHDFDPDKAAFPSPRSWAFLSTMLNNLPMEDVPAVATATVGESATAVFWPFWQSTISLPDFNDIVNTPDAVPISSNANINYATAVMVALRLDGTNINQAWRFVARMKEEYAFLCLFTMMARTSEWPKLGSSQGVRDWVQSRPHLFSSR